MNLKGESRKNRSKKKRDKQRTDHGDEAVIWKWQRLALSEQQTQDNAAHAKMKAWEMKGLHKGESEVLRNREKGGGESGGNKNK